MIDSRNEWDPLLEVVVGSATGANWPMTDEVFLREAKKSTWTSTSAPGGPVPQWIIDEANRELDILAETLVNLGIRVTRPDPMDFVEHAGMYNYCPRDRLIIAGDTVVDVNMMYPCRNQEIKNYYKVLAKATNIFTMPRNLDMVLDAANICRLGDTWLFLESASGNQMAYNWLCDMFPKIKIELCNFYSGVHIDSTIAPLRPGLVMLNATRVNERNCPKALDGWQKIWVSDDMIVPQDFYQYPYASKWIAMNLLMVDPETAIVDAAQVHLHRVLKQHGITVIPLTLTHARTLGGGFHCVTLDIKRQHQ